MKKVIFLDRNVVIRIVKPYPEAKNHLYLGCAVDFGSGVVALDCTVLNFGRPTSDDPTGGLTISTRATRWIPLQRIEYIRELPEDLDPFQPDRIDVAADGNISYHATERPDLIPE
jgi:hypothetical protein